MPRINFTLQTYNDMYCIPNTCGIFSPTQTYCTSDVQSRINIFFLTILNAQQTNSIKHSLSSEAQSLRQYKHSQPVIQLKGSLPQYQQSATKSLSWVRWIQSISSCPMVWYTIHKYKEKATIQLQFVISPSLVGGTSVVMDHQTPYSPGPSSPLRESRCDRTCLNATPWATVSLFRAHVVWFGTENSTHLHVMSPNIFILPSEGKHPHQYL